MDEIITTTLVVGDLHWGIRRDDKWVYDYQYEALKKITDYAKLNGIKTIIQTGDAFDVRSSVSQITLNRVRTEIMPLFDGLQLIIPVGNHDMRYREMIQPNTLEEVLGHYDNVTIINKPTTVMLNDKVPIDIIPWICNENRDDIMDFIKKSKTKYCVGHFELDGYYFYQGMKSSGADPSFLKKYDRVFSGHYHTISEGGNVLYVGTPYTLTSGDGNDSRGVWELQFTNKKCTEKFIENDVMNHVKIRFNAETFDKKTVGDYKGKHVDVKVVKRESDNGKMNVNKFEQLLIDAGVHSLKISDTINYDDIELVTSDDIIIKDNMDLVEDYISQLDCDENSKKSIKRMFDSMYIEAIKLKSDAGL